LSKMTAKRAKKKVAGRVAAKKAGKKKVPKKAVAIDRFALIEAALRKLAKQELVEWLVRAARQDDDFCYDLESELSIELPNAALLDNLHEAIRSATDFDQRMMNHNFDYDYRAYERIAKGFKKLVTLGMFDDVKRLSIELMKRGSYQVVCSDEGMMCEDIEACLVPVIRAVRSSDADNGQAWGQQMIEADHSGFVCEKELGKLIR